MFKFKFILLLFIISAAATTPLNAFQPLPGSLQGTRKYSRVMRDLVERQDPCGVGIGIPISEARMSNCCPTGAAYCSYDSTSFDGCCGAGKTNREHYSNVCGFPNDSRQPSCQPSEGNGGGAICGNSDSVGCSNFNFCCPVGQDCQVDANNNLRCAPASTSAVITPTSAAPQPPSTIPSPSTLPSPTTSPSAPPSATLTGSQPSATPTSGDLGKLDALYGCAPCGQSQCTFDSDGTQPDERIYNLIVGTPVSNCQTGTNSSVSDTVGGSVTIGEAWSVDGSVGLNLGFLSIGGGGSWSHSSSITYDQSITIEVGPGQMGVLVAIVKYKQTNGTIQVHTGEVFPAISNQPIAVMTYSSDIVSCKSQFDANASSVFNCTNSATGGPLPNAGTGWEGDTQLISLTSTIVIVLLSVFLLV